MLKYLEKNQEAIQIAASYVYEMNQKYESFPLFDSIEEIKDTFNMMVDHDDDIILILSDQFNNIEGLLALFVDIDTRFIQAQGGIYVNDENNGQLFIDYINKNYKGYTISFGLSDKNEYLINLLKTNDYVLDEDSFYMRLDNGNENDVNTLADWLTTDYEEGFIKLHNHINPGMYWDGLSIVERFDLFSVFIYKENEEVIGSVVTEGYDDSAEIFAISVYEKHRYRHIQEQLLQKVIDYYFKELNVNYIINYVHKNADVEYKACKTMGFNEKCKYLTYKKDI